MNKIHTINKTLRPCYTRTYKKRRSPLLQEQNVEDFSRYKLGALSPQLYEASEYNYHSLEQRSQSPNKSNFRFWAFAALIIFLTIVTSLTIVIQIANKKKLPQEYSNNLPKINNNYKNLLSFDLGLRASLWQDHK
ncbi:hypothetical protein M0812_16079 [Anaeramoeba flamelloides]|uniref:Uncharacterized protein n=1 Tax=Anaeramoeba flamelloides TaxID=1746091 RepID=A0AAV7ZG35_9EUKA|nr:hypothetical protein M0812_16079 [Anaeramoeba flamelloides]